MDPLYMDRSNPSAQWVGENVRSFFSDYGPSSADTGEILQRLGPQMLAQMQQQRQQRELAQQKMAQDQLMGLMKLQSDSSGADADRANKADYYRMLQGQFSEGQANADRRLAQMQKLEEIKAAAEYKRAKDTALIQAIGARGANLPPNIDMLITNMKLDLKKRYKMPDDEAQRQASEYYYKLSSPAKDFSMFMKDLGPGNGEQTGAPQQQVMVGGRHPQPGQPPGQPRRPPGPAAGPPGLAGPPVYSDRDQQEETGGQDKFKKLIGLLAMMSYGGGASAVMQRMTNGASWPPPGGSQQALEDKMQEEALRQIMLKELQATGPRSIGKGFPPVLFPSDQPRFVPPPR